MVEQNDHTDTPDLDLEIVTDTFRSIVDQDAFDALIVSWNAKLEALGADNKLQSQPFSEALLKQLSAARSTLEKLDIRAENNPLERLVSEVAGPAMVLGPDLRVASINTEGAISFGASSGAFFDPDSIDPSSMNAWNALVRAANQKGNLANTVVHVWDQEQENRRFHAEAFLVWLPKQDKPNIAVRTLDLGWSPEMSHQLREAFDLTEAEIEVGRQFFETCDLSQVANTRGVSLHTVRTQMKTIQAKTDASSQADLIRLFAMVASRGLLAQRGLATVWSDPLGREKLIHTTQGRTIAWTWMGAPDGTPAVFLRGMAMGYLLPQKAEERLAAAGVKLFIPSRPGYGNSSLHPEVSALEDNRASLQIFIEQLGLKGCVAVGLSDGIIPILAEQDRDPEQFSALVSVGFNGCLNRAGCAKLPVPQATLLRLAKVAPRLLDLIAKLGFRMMQQYGVDWYLDRAHASTPLDLKTSRSPETATLVRDACSHLAVQGTPTFVRDMQMFHAPVDSAIDRLSVPMLSMVPTEDGIFDLADYQALERRNAHVTVLPVANTADLLIYQETEFIIDRIIGVVQRNR